MLCPCHNGSGPCHRAPVLLKIPKARGAWLARVYLSGMCLYTCVCVSCRTIVYSLTCLCVEDHFEPTHVCDTRVYLWTGPALFLVSTHGSKDNKPL